MPLSSRETNSRVPPGIGAEYPLSAIITSEWSSTQSRATMLSSVFLMQPVGQALAQLVGLFVLLGFDNSKQLQTLRCGLDTAHADECRKAVDGIWRIVIGSGAVPALLAIIFRFFLFDCGLYSLEVRNKPSLAIQNTQRVYGAPTGGFSNSFQMQSQTNGVRPEISPRPMPVQFSKEDLYNYFIRDGNWYYLLGTAATWFFLDVSFYGLSLDNRRTLSDMWATAGPTPIDERLECWNSTLPGGQSLVPSWAQNGLPVWQTDAMHPCNTIYDVLIEQTKQYLLTVSLASIAGSVCFIFFANRIPRRQWLTASFLILAVFFVITGGVYYRVNRSPAAPATVVFVALCHFMFNFGTWATSQQAAASMLTIRHTRCKHTDFYHPCRDIPHVLSMHLPRHLGRRRQAGQHRCRRRRLRHQRGLQEPDAPGPYLPALRLRRRLWRHLLVGVPARLAAPRGRGRRPELPRDQGPRGAGRGPREGPPGGRGGHRPREVGGHQEAEGGSEEAQREPAAVSCGWECVTGLMREWTRCTD